MTRWWKRSSSPVLSSIAALTVVVVLAHVAPASAQLDGILPSQTEQAADELENGSTIAASPVPDTTIAERIRAIYRGIDGLERVRVSSDAGVVTLSGRVADAALAERALTLAERVEGVVTVNSTIEEVTNLDERLTNVAERAEARLWQFVALLPLLLVALLVFALVVLVGRWVSRRGWPFDRIAPNAFIANLLRQVVLIASVLIGLVLALDILNATALLSTVLGAAGILGLAVGFAVRDTVENYVASILLSLRQPFRPNDVILLDDHIGTVTKLTSRATILMTPDGNHLRIPNAAVYKAVITNFTLNPGRRFLFELGVDAESDLARAVSLGLDVLRAAPFTRNDPPPQAWIERVGDSNVVVSYAAWIDQRETDFLKAKGEAMRLVKTALEDEGFSLPEPIYRLRVDELPRIDTGGEMADRDGQVAATLREEDALEPAPEPQALDTSPDRAVIERVETERATDDGDANLLDADAPREI